MQVPIGFSWSCDALPLNLIFRIETKVYNSQYAKNGQLLFDIRTTLNILNAYLACELKMFKDWSLCWQHNTLVYSRMI